MKFFTKENYLLPSLMGRGWGRGCFSFCLLLFSTILSAQEAHLVKVGKGFSSTSVNTAIFRCNSLVTDGDEQYISYYDADGYLTLAKRSLGSEEWTLQRSQYKGKVTDAHNVISMAVDGDGYLHVAFDHHGQTLNYCRGTEPRSLELGDKEPMTGTDEDDVTYPQFFRLADGDLLFAYRSGTSGDGNLVLNRYSVSEKTWSRVQDILIDGEGERNAYWQMCVDGDGVLHLSWVWRETWAVETNHDLCYARSTDNGETWEKSDGTPYELPITQENAEYACRVKQNSELINQTCITADEEGHPYIASYWCHPVSKIPQFRLVWHDGNGWQERMVGRRTKTFTLKGGGTKMIPVSRPCVVVDGLDVYYIFRDIERGSKVTIAHTDDVLQGEWKMTDLTTFAVDAWEPTIDTELWKRDQKLHIFLQRTKQGDGEKTVPYEPQPVYVLEVK